MAREQIMKNVEWNGHTYSFYNETRHTNTRTHDILIMIDEHGREVTGESVWINRPWHRFDLEEAFDEIVEKEFGPKALKLVQEIDKEAYSVEQVIKEFFEQLKPEDVVKEEESEEKIDTTVEGRMRALAKYLKVNVAEIINTGDNEFEIDDETYAVLTDAEAEEEFEQSVRNLWEELGLEAVSENFKEHIIENCIDEDEAKEYVREIINDEVYYMDDIEVADECINEGLVDSADVYDEESDEWSPELRDDVDIDNLREELIQYRVDNEDIMSYIIDMYGYDGDAIINLLDEDKVIEELKDEIEVNGNGRGQEIAYYDGEEIELEGGLFAYRRN